MAVTVEQVREKLEERVAELAKLLWRQLYKEVNAHHIHDVFEQYGSPTLKNIIARLHDAEEYLTLLETGELDTIVIKE